MIEPDWMEWTQVGRLTNKLATARSHRCTISTQRAHPQQELGSMCSRPALGIDIDRFDSIQTTSTCRESVVQQKRSAPCRRLDVSRLRLSWHGATDPDESVETT